MPKLQSDTARRHSLNIPVPNLVIVGLSISSFFLLLGLLQRLPAGRDTHSLNILLPKVWGRALVWQPGESGDLQMGFAASFGEPQYWTIPVLCATLLSSLSHFQGMSFAKFTFDSSSHWLGNRGTRMLLSHESRSQSSMYAHIHVFWNTFSLSLLRSKA